MNRAEYRRQQKEAERKKKTITLSVEDLDKAAQNLANEKARLVVEDACREAVKDYMAIFSAAMLAGLRETIPHWGKVRNDRLTANINKRVDELNGIIHSRNFKKLEQWCVAYSLDYTELFGKESRLKVTPAEVDEDGRPVIDLDMEETA